MQARFCDSDRLEDFEDFLLSIDREGFGSLLIFACDGNEWPSRTFNEVLRKIETPTLGGIFPAIAMNSTKHEQGAIVVGLDERPEVARITGMSDATANYEAQVLEQIENWQGLEGDGTLIVLVDGLARRISSLVEDLFFVFGLESNFVGGGAGSLSFQQKPCIISPQRLEKDTAIVMRLPRASAIGVTHGWAGISEALEVTEADRNVVKSLNWQPAFEAYKAIVDRHCSSPIEKDAFFETAKSYPLGLQKIGGAHVVRDPLMVQNETELVCVGEVHQGAFVRVLNGDSDSLLSAAGQARALVDSASACKNGDLMLFDCISRALFLGERIDEELTALTQGEPAFGAFTLGEIANNGKEYLEFLNKTTVLSRIDKVAI